MIDDETILLVSAYIDGELSPMEMLDFERRLSAEPELRAFAEELGLMSSRVGIALATVPVPEGLAARVAPYRSSTFNFHRWGAIAASLVLGFVIGGSLVATLAMRSPGNDASISDMVFASHLRGLAAPEPFDIASSDRHVVKPWFNGRTTVAPVAPDLSADGFPLLGGRIDIVLDSPVPTLVYSHDRHVISVTVISDPPKISEGEDGRDGSTIMRWTIGNLTYLAVSDLNRADFRRFVSLFQAAAK